MNDLTDAMSERDAAILEAVERVQARLATGVAEASALAEVPAGVREEVEVTLRALSRVRGLAEAPSSAFGPRLEASFLDAVDVARAQQGAARAPRGWFGAALLRTAAMLGAVVLALAGGGFAAVQASESTIPGDALYPVKEAGETVRLYFARGDGVTRLRLAQLVRRQRELESALQRGAPARVLLALEVRVATSTKQLVELSTRLEAAGNPAPAQATLEAVKVLQGRIDVLTASEARPDVARTLSRMSNFLAAQERELETVAPGERLAPTPGTPPASPGGGTSGARETPGGPTAADASATPLAQRDAVPAATGTTPTPGGALRESTPVATRPALVPTAARDAATPTAPSTPTRRP